MYIYIYLYIYIYIYIYIYRLSPLYEWDSQTILGKCGYIIHHFILLRLNPSPSW